MKKVFVFSVFLFLSICACTDVLEIEPKQAITTEVALSTEAGIKSAIVGIYKLLIVSDFFNGDAILNSDLLIDDDNIVWTTFFADLTPILYKEIPTNNLPVESFWINAYRIINQCNNIIDAIALVYENDQNVAVAEVKFLRGMMYFDLVNLYAKTKGDGNPSINLGVPIVDIPIEQSLSNPFIPRNTVDEVYQFILEDLVFAAQHLNDHNRIFATSYAAKALLSRVFLMQEQYEMAASEADDIIESNAFTILPDLVSVFNSSENTAEDIFSLQFTTNEGVNYLSKLYGGLKEGGNEFIGITDNHVTKYEAEDKRGTLFYFDQQRGKRRTSKWKPIKSNDGNITLIRLAEMYLTRSECRFRNGDIEGAANDLNVIRKRAGLSDILPNEISLEVILKERFLELVFEGHQFRDVKRTRQSVGDMAFDDPRLIFPIPQREMDVNKALVQNEGY